MHKGDFNGNHEIQDIRVSVVPVIPWFIGFCVLTKSARIILNLPYTKINSQVALHHCLPKKQCF